MRFELTDDQQAIQRTAKEFLASRYPAEEVRRLALEDERGFTDDQWRAIAELGWPALVVPEDDGGLGLGVVELAVLQEQLGYALAPTPLLSTVSAALVIAAAGDDAQRAEWLPGLAEGERRGTIAQLPPAGGLQGGDAGDGALTATLEAVPDAAGADLLVVPTGHERLAVVDMSAAGVTVEPVDGLDPTRRLSTRDARRRAVRDRSPPPTARPSRARGTSSRSPSRPSRSGSPSARWRWRSSTPATASSSGARSASSRRSRTRARRCSSRSRARARP